MALELVKTEWTLAQDIEPGSVPDLNKKYGSRTVYRPHSIVILASAWFDGNFRLDKVTLNGFRVLKDGTLGDGIVESFATYEFNQMPKWVDPLVQEALAMVGRD